MLRLRALVLLVATLVAGCSTYAGSRYAMSSETVTALRSHRGRTVAVGTFTSTSPGRSEITCRGVGPIKTPDAEPFEEYVRRALLAELTFAELASPNAPVTLTGKLDLIDFSSGVTDAVWNIALSVTSSNGNRLSVREDYQFKSSFVGEVACQQTAQALMPAVQNLVRRVVEHPAFGQLLTPGG